MAKKITIYLGCIISLVFVIILVKIVDFRTVWSALKAFNLKYLVLLLALFIYQMIVRTIRWQILISQNKRISFWQTFIPLSIGFMVNNVLPAKIGELVRAEYIARQNKISRAFSLGTVFAERMLDVCLVLIFLAGSIIFSKTLLDIVKSNVWLLVALMVIIGFILLILLSDSVQKHLMSFLPKRFQKAFRGLMQRMAESVKFLLKGRLFFPVATLTLLIWFGVVLGYVLVFKAFGLRLPVYGYFAVVSIGSIGMVIPSTSANIGVYDAIVMSAIMLFAINKDAAFAVAAVTHALDIFPNIALGIGSLLKENLSLLNIGGKYFKKTAD